MVGHKEGPNKKIRSVFDHHNNSIRDRKPFRIQIVVRVKPRLPRLSFWVD